MSLSIFQSESHALERHEMLEWFCRCLFSMRYVLHGGLMVSCRCSLRYGVPTPEALGTLPHNEMVPQCIGLPPTGSGNHHPDGPGTGHALGHVLIKGIHKPLAM